MPDLTTCPRPSCDGLCDECLLGKQLSQLSQQVIAETFGTKKYHCNHCSKSVEVPCTIHFKEQCENYRKQK